MSNTLSNSVDYIIVGLGLAGINLCCELERGGKNYLVFDDERSPASFKAAGLINPITGRNYAKSWRIDELIPVALENYHFLNEWLEGEYIIPLDIRRALNNISEENKWASRFGETGYKPYLTDQSFYDLSDSGFCDNSRSVRIDGAYQVRTKKLTINFKDHLMRTGRCLNETFDFSSVDYGHSTYKGIEFDNIVCCEGALGKHTPFDYVPIIPNLGEVLHVELAKTQPSFAFKKKVFVVPQEGGYYWVGGTYKNLKSEDEVQPDFDRLISMFEDAYSGEYRIIKKTYGLRPTIPDRKPVIGPHHTNQHLYILNGLGTKGASLGPYSARALLAHIENNVQIDDEMSVSRYE